MTILCPVDFSATTAALVPHAAALAAGTGAQLRLLHVLEVPLAVLYRPGPEVAQQLAHWQQVAAQAGAQVSASVVQAPDAAPEIVAEAQRCGASLIMLGAHGRTGLTRLLMGSTAETVVRTAPCVTLLVKPPAVHSSAAA